MADLMTDPARAELHRLLDRIPTGAVATAKRFLESLAEPVARALREAPLDDEPETRKKSPPSTRLLPIPPRICLSSTSAGLSEAHLLSSSGGTRTGSKDMGKTKGRMQQEYPSGSLVKIANRDMLEEFMRTWKYHHKLQPQQLEFADKVGRVELYGFYHGGDELYRVDGIPGIWHERCLEAYTPPS